MHVLGATKILEQQLRRLVAENRSATPFMRFLYNTWLYLDVLSSLSSGEDPFILNIISSNPLSPVATPIEGLSPAGNFSLQNEIDSLLGCAGDLFPLIARMSRVSNRLADKVITQNELQYIDDGIQIREELNEWQAPDINILQA